MFIHSEFNEGDIDGVKLLYNRKSLHSQRNGEILQTFSELIKEFFFVFNASEMISSTILLCVLVIVFDTIESSAFGQHIRVSVEPQKFLEFNGLNVSEKYLVINSILDNIFVSAHTHTSHSHSHHHTCVTFAT